MAGSWFVPRVGKVSRGKGDAPATAKAAYRAGARIHDERLDEVHDYRRKGGIETAFILGPADANPILIDDRAALWNHAEATDKRKNSVTARELILPLPADVDQAPRREIAAHVARFLVERYGVAADVAIHVPHREGDERNHHAHILFTTRRLGRDGLAEKIRVLDDVKQGPKEIEAIRQAAAAATNRILEREGVAYRVDHRSYERRGMDREPTQHMGPAATAQERKGEETRIGDKNRAIEERNRDRENRRRQEAAAREQFRRAAASRVPENLIVEGQVPAPIPANHVPAKIRRRRKKTADTFRRAVQPEAQKPAPKTVSKPVPARTRRREQSAFERWANRLRAATQSRQLEQKGEQGRAHTEKRRELNARLAQQHGPHRKAAKDELTAIRQAEQRGGWWYRLTRATAAREQAQALRKNLGDMMRRIREERGKLAAQLEPEKQDLAQRHERERQADEQRIEKARARREADGWKPLPPRPAETEKEREETRTGNGEPSSVSERVRRRRQEREQQRRQRGDRPGPDRDREP